MTDAAPAIFVAIEGSSFAAAIRQSPFALHDGECRPYPLADGVLRRRSGDGPSARRIFFGDLARRDAATRAHRRDTVGFIGLLASGRVLFAAEASHVILNPLFKIKLILILLGLTNVGLFEMLAASRVRDLQPGTPMPAAARIIGISSLVIWLGVAASGRLIAYF